MPTVDLHVVLGEPYGPEDLPCSDGGGHVHTARRAVGEVETGRGRQGYRHEPWGRRGFSAV